MKNKNRKMGNENLNVKCKLKNANPKTIIENYLSVCGVENVNQYLQADESKIQNPNLYLNIDTAISRLKSSIDNREKVAILVDCDNDGLCSSVICYDFFKRHGLVAKPIFHTGIKAHGIKMGSDKDMISKIKNLNPDLLIIPDASADGESSKELVKNGIDVLIFDHHEYDFESNPYAIIVNCLQQENTNQAASGTVVMQKIIDRYCDVYGESKIDNSDLIASSIASDVMSLKSIENRAYMNIAMRMKYYE